VVDFFSLFDSQTRGTVLCRDLSLLCVSDQGSSRFAYLSSQRQIFARSPNKAR
jgi:hypothetical protein